jgi:hypothetical protein
MPISPPASTEEPVSQSVPEPLPETLPERIPDSLLQQIVEPEPEPVLNQSEKAVTLTRPKWQPVVPKAVPAAITTDELPAPPTEESEGFSLRFESDLALSRLVAASQIGVYAIEGDRARRMTINNSNINFWDASVPNSFHEMEVSTVPQPVVNALVRTGADTAKISWGVTLPGKLKSQLDRLMQEHRGGALVIGTDGNIRLEAL